MRHETNLCSRCEHNIGITTLNKLTSVKANGCVPTVTLLQTIQPLFLPPLTVETAPSLRLHPLLQVLSTWHCDGARTFLICPVMYINKNNLSPFSSVFCHSWKQHKYRTNFPFSCPSQEHLRRCKLHWWNSAGPGPAGRDLLPLQVLQVQGPQLPHPLKQPNFWIHITRPIPTN